MCISYGAGVRTLSRYTDYSERTLFRFIENAIDWKVIFVKIFKQFLYSESEVYLLVADETIEGKSGTATYGVDTFYSSILQICVRSVNLFGFSLVGVGSKKSSFLGFNQVIYTASDKLRITETNAKKVAAKGQPKGRKKGQKNAPKDSKVEHDTAPFRTFKSFFIGIMDLLSTHIAGINIAYLVIDSAYGNIHYMELAKQKGLSIISKLRSMPALYFNYDGTQGKGRPKKYGDKVDVTRLSQKYLVSVKTEKGIFFQVYQYKAWNKEMAEYLLNIVTIVATNRKTGKTFHTHFFSNDLQLSAQDMIDYYSLRFQIEYEFREAKQLFGLHKLKNFHQIQMTNMFHLSFLALLCAKIWQRQWAEKLAAPNLSIIDLKNIFKAQWNLKNAIKLAKNDPNLFFNPQFMANFAPQDLINAA